MIKKTYIVSHFVCLYALQIVEKLRMKYIHYKNIIGESIFSNHRIAVDISLSIVPISTQEY